MNFETIIGLEVHVELKQIQKFFSPAPAQFRRRSKYQHQYH